MSKDLAGCEYLDQVLQRLFDIRQKHGNVRVGMQKPGSEFVNFVPVSVALHQASLGGEIDGVMFAERSFVTSHGKEQS